MNTYKIKVVDKTNIFKTDEDIKVFIDGISIKKRKSVYSHMVSEGKHTLRIEQVKLYKSKYFYILMPLYLLDCSILDKSPLYAVYEVEFYVDKDIDIAITLESKHLKEKAFVRINDCRFNVVFENETEKYLLRNEFSATDSERKRWFTLNIIFTSLPITFLMCIFVLLTFQIIKQSKPLIASVFFMSISVFFILLYIFFFRNIYANYKNKNIKY